MSVVGNSKFLSSFWDLASDERDKRIHAAHTIVESVSVSNTNYGNSTDMEYALKRLVRGLGSSRESARHGFVTCLTELFTVNKSIDADMVFALIDEHTKVIISFLSLFSILLLYVKYTFAMYGFHT